MSENRIENEFETRISETVGELVDEEQLILPPAYLRQRVMEDFERHFIAVTKRRRSWTWLLPRQMNWSFQGVVTAGTLLLVAGLGLAIILIRNDRLSWFGTGSYSGVDPITAGSPTSQVTVGIEGAGGSGALTPSVFDYFAAQQNGGEDFAESYAFYDELPDAVDSEYLIFVEVPADQLALQEELDPVDTVLSGQAGIARLAIGDDGMVRAIQVPVKSLPQ